MGHENNNIISRKGKHITYEERIKIEALYQRGLTPSDIGEELGSRSRRTIERELSLGKYDRESSYKLIEAYSADIAQKKRSMNNTNKGPALKIGKNHALVEYLENGIKSGFSPYAVLQNIVNEKKIFDTTICIKTFYAYIDNGLFLGITNKDLPVKRDGKRRDYHKIRQALTNVKGTSIADRPKGIDKREEIGHWEMDTVVGKQGTKTVLLVLSERALRKEMIFKMTGKKQDEVIRVLNSIEREVGRKAFSQVFKTMTTDNGGEFLDFEGIEKSLFAKTKKRTKMYYAHPYSSWERGTNENINKMIRRFIPKGADIANYSKEDIQRIEYWINNYPRKVLGGLSANLAEKKYMAA